jgi:hypothetical protein
MYHGIEYRLVLKDKSYKMIVSANELENRLLISNYFKKHKSTWYSPELHKTNYAKLILDPDFNIELTIQEYDKLDLFLQQIPRHKIEHHGWYEVNYKVT